jgi:hypothetical protein
MTPLEQAIAAIRALPPEDRRQLQQWLREQEQRDAQEQARDATPPTVQLSRSRHETPEQQVERFHKALNWIDEHRAEYLGQWVALEGDRLIAHGPDALAVDRAARAAGIESPFLEQVREKEGPFCGGWL